jgi:hypothetical protein
MKQNATWKRITAWLLAAALCVTLLPGLALAAEDDPAWTAVGLDELADGDTVAVVMHAAVSDADYVLLNNGGTKTYGPAAVWDGATTGETTWQWSVQAVDGGYRFHPVGDPDSWLYCLDQNNGLRVGSEAGGSAWSLDEASGYLKVTDPSGNTRYLGVYDNNNGAAIEIPNFRTYKNTTGNTKNQTIAFYKLSAGEASAQPTAPSKAATPTALPAGGTVQPGGQIALFCDTEGVSFQVSTDNSTWAGLADSVYTIPESADGLFTVYLKAMKADLEDSDVLALTYTVAGADEVSIQTALAADVDTEGLTVRGVVTLVDGRNVYIQDATGGICLYFDAAPSGLNRGDTVVATGKRAVYKQLPELTVTQETCRTSAGADLAPKAVAAVSALSADDVCTYVQLTGLTVTELYDNNGQWTSTPTVTVKDADGNPIQLYKAALAKTDDGWGLAVDDIVTVTGAVGTNNGTLQLRTMADGDIQKTGHVEATQPEEPAVTAYQPVDGDLVALYCPGKGLAMAGDFSGTQASVEGSALLVQGEQFLLRVSVNDAGQYTFTTTDGKYLTTGATGGALSLADAADDYALWELEAAENGWFIKNVNAKYGSNSQYLEYYNGFKSYSKSASADSAIYTMEFFQTVRTPAVTDSSVVEAIAAWGGGGPYTEAQAQQINGDLYTVGDMQDTDAVFTVLAGGAAGTPYQATKTQTGGTNYYMGGANIGAAAGDYLQFAVSSAGWGDMTLSFRMRATNAAPGSFQLQYSVDGGATFENFTTGSYSYAYTKYSSDGTSTPVSGSGAVTDGVARTSISAGNYLTFQFQVPSGAANASQLLLRLAAGTDRADGKQQAISGNIRIDSVVLSGSPVVSADVTGYVCVTPDGKEEDQSAGTELTMTCATDGATILYRFNGGDWETYDQAAKPVLPDPLPASLEVKATSEGRAPSVKRIFTYAAGTVSAVRFAPNGGGVYIAQEGDSEPVTLSCDTAGATIYYATSPDGAVYSAYGEYTAPIVLQKGFGKLYVKAYAAKDGFNASAESTRIFTERQSGTYGLYFGQIHSHTNFSDGAGSPEDAFSHATGVSDLDFLAVTDHSNSLDNADSASILTSSAGEWETGHQLADQYTTDTFVGIYGFEMTWSNGLGHMNTFNTAGFQSRTQTEFSTYSTALQNYYAALKTDSNSLSQFNHPGTTFGDFSDFAYYDEEIDQLITLIEVGNGEGAIGSSGYFPSYEYYTRALDKGWHVAPSNNQDNHKGNWGDSNTGRTVVLSDGLSRENIYDAIRNYRVYATEDSDLNILYTLDGSTMGTILDGASGETAAIKVELSDKTDAGLAQVEVIVNGGKSLASASATCNETVTFDVPATYSYYYIKVTQADGDIAVTAPVWLGKVEAVGISSFAAEKSITVAGEAQSFALTLYNNESSPLLVTSITFTDKATGLVLGTDSTIASVAKLSTASCGFTHTFAADGMVTVVATVTGTLNGVEKVYTQDLQLTVMPAEIVSRILVDGTHSNDYVTGYYGGNLSNMTTIAGNNAVEVTVVTDEITPAMLANCALLVISAPARKSGTANAGAYTASTFSDDFIAMVKDYVEGGGSVAVCGLADYQDTNAVHGADGHAAAQLNKLLEAIGSTMRIHDDEVIDDTHNGGQPFRLYPENFNTESQWTRGLVSGQTYSQYSGCSVDPGEGTWLVRGFDTTWGADSDKDGVGVLPGVSYTYTYSEKQYTLNAVTDMGDVVFLAAEESGHGGTIFASGGVFLSDFEVKAELDNIWDLPYANRTIYENILNSLCATRNITDIDTVNHATLNRLFVIEGYVTSGTTNPNTTFFDAIYVQDATGGIVAFPYATEGLAIGTKVRIIGYTDAYQGNREIQILSLTALDAPAVVYAPQALTTRDAMDYEQNGGKLVSVTGQVSGIEYAGGRVSLFHVTDASGTAATVFIDGYITNPAGVNNIGSWLQVGDTVTAAGLVYISETQFDGAALRVRNCDEVTRVQAAGSTTPTTPVPSTGADEDFASDSGTVELPEDSVPTTSTPPTVERFTDLDGHWAYAFIQEAVERGWFEGVSQTTFAPDTALDRAMFVTLLWRMNGAPTGSGTTPFTDLTADWYQEAVSWGYWDHVTEGVNADRFAPTQALTREQLVLMLYRLSGDVLHRDVSARADLSAYADSPQISGWAAEAMSWAVATGLLQGGTDGLLDPQGVATRAQSAVILCRFAPQT